jgi:hypothetical protein
VLRLPSPIHSPFLHYIDTRRERFAFARRPRVPADRDDLVPPFRLLGHDVWCIPWGCGARLVTLEIFFSVCCSRDVFNWDGLLFKVPTYAMAICDSQLIFFLSARENLELSVIRCDHRNASTITVTKVFSKIWTAPEPVTFADIAVGEHMVAVIIGDSVDLNLLFCRFTDGIIHSVRVGSRVGGTLPSCIITPHGFYITRQCPSTESGAEISQLRASVKNPSTIDDFKIHQVFEPIPGYTAAPARTIYCAPGKICFPKYGVLSITLRRSRHRPTCGGRQNISAIHFWPAEVESSRSQLTPGPLCVYEHPCVIRNLEVGSSGTCAITLDKNNALGLVRYSSQPAPRVEFQRLHLPEVRVNAAIKTGMDDGLGILYILDLRTNRGRCPIRLTTVSYA